MYQIKSPDSSPDLGPLSESRLLSGPNISTVEALISSLSLKNISNGREDLLVALSATYVTLDNVGFASFKPDTSKLKKIDIINTPIGELNALLERSGDSVTDIKLSPGVEGVKYSAKFSQRSN